MQNALKLRNYKKNKKTSVNYLVVLFIKTDVDFGRASRPLFLI